MKVCLKTVVNAGDHIDVYATDATDVTAVVALQQFWFLLQFACDVIWQ